MIVNVIETMVVHPAVETAGAGRSLWTSDVDQLFPKYTQSVYFYKPNGSLNFFQIDVLKDALSKALVVFYPLAGRLKRDKDGRREIECNDKGGVVFVVAEMDALIEDLGDFTPSTELGKLVTKVEYNMDDISSIPLLLLQVTYFKCGGVSLGVCMEHTTADGASGTHFLKTWSDIARGLDVKITPFFDRTLLRARDPPIPSFPHIEYQSPPSMKNPEPKAKPISTSVSMFKISCDQLNLLKSKCKKGSNPINFTTFEVLAGHIWRCVCKARDLQDDQETMLSIPTDGRSRLTPPLPLGYLGNGVIHASLIEVSSNLISRPLIYAVEMIHKALARMTEEYLRSAIDYLALNLDSAILARGPSSFNCPNFAINSWCRMPLFEADFGWGRPIFTGPGAIPYEGLAFLLPTAVNDGSLSLAVSLPPDQMPLFKEYLYNF